MSTLSSSRKKSLQHGERQQRQQQQSGASSRQGLRKQEGQQQWLLLQQSARKLHWKAEDLLSGLPPWHHPAALLDRQQRTATARHNLQLALAVAWQQAQ
jgi:hypothetical protein